MTQYAHRIWGQEEGLFQPTIYSLLQTRDGLIWLGTQDSLIRFDGIHFREFDEGRSVLHGSLIRSLAQDTSGNLWAASLGSGLVRIAPDGNVKQFSTRNGLRSNVVFSVIAAADGSVWACTSDGLVRILGEHLQLFTTADGLASNRLRTACVAGDGALWVAGLDEGLSRQTGSRFSEVSLPERFARASINALACSSDGAVWVGGLAGLTSISARQPSSYTSADGLPDNEVLSLAQGRDGTLWIGTDGGVTRLRNGELSVYRPRDGLSHSQVLALMVDREGDLWAGTKNGLDQFADGKVTPFTTSEGLLSNDAGPVIEDHSGRLWIGTANGGLNCFDGRRVCSLTTRQGLTSDSIFSLALSPAGDLWVGTANGLNRLRDGKISQTYRVRDGLLGPEVHSLFVDSGGVLWIGTNRGLQSLAGGTFKNRFPSAASVLAITGDNPGRIFASLSDSELYLLQGQRFARRTLTTSHPVDCFLLDSAKRTLWMGTLGSGLLRYRNGVLTHIYVKDGLYDNRIYSILRDDQSNVWLASSKGIFRLTEGELNDFADGRRSSVTSLPFSTGQLRFECQGGVEPAACRTRDGRLWFSTTTGVVVIDPKHLQSNLSPPPVKIFALLVDGERYPPYGRIHIKPGRAHNMEIRYAGLSFVSPEKVTFRYRLDGYDRRWVDAGSRREAFYTNLPPGAFAFAVEARNADGVWSSRPAVLTFAVDPRLYQHIWFFPALAALLGLAAFAFLRLRIRRLKQRFALVLAERNRIARELHDTLLQGLSGMTMQLQALWTTLPPTREREQLSEIIRDAGRCSREARQSLWGLRTGDPIDRIFSEKLRQMARECVANRHIALHERIEPVDLSTLPDAEYQLLRISREAIANTIKHAGALHLTVSLQQANSSVILSVQDDGLGFLPADSAPQGHFGVQGMHERAAEIGAELSVLSSASGGTRITVTLPLTAKSAAPGNLHPVDAHQSQ